MKEEAEKMYSQADEVLREVWHVKEMLSEEYGNDLQALFAISRMRMHQSGHEIVNLHDRTTSLAENSPPR